MPLMKVVPDAIQGHAKDVGVTSSQIQDNMTTVGNAIEALKPAMVGANSNAAHEHYLGLRAAVTKLLEVSNQYSTAVVAHSNRVSETDYALGQRIGQQQV